MLGKIFFLNRRVFTVTDKKQFKKTDCYISQAEEAKFPKMNPAIRDKIFVRTKTGPPDTCATCFEILFVYFSKRFCSLIEV